MHERVQPQVAKAILLVGLGLLAVGCGSQAEAKPASTLPPTTSSGHTAEVKDGRLIFTSELNDGAGGYNAVVGACNGPNLDEIVFSSNSIEPNIRVFASWGLCPGVLTLANVATVENIFSAK